MKLVPRIFFAAVLVAASLPSGHLAAQGQDPDRRPARPAPGVRSSGLYIVQMAELPVGSYAGGVAGLERTKPGRGRKIDATSPAVVGYRSYLNARHDETLARVGGRKVYDYGYVFNGFAAQITEAQAEALKAAPGVLTVVKDELRVMDTSSTPSFLGLDAAGGAWAQAGGVGSAGEDVVVGIVDSGIWPENPSFSDRTGTDGKKSYQHIPGWSGHCRPGEAFPASKCNQKLIGARHYNAGWGGDAGLKAQLPWEYASPRDFNGHGSHTASTAAGNHGVALTGDAAAFGSISGIAPRARISVYKALWALADGRASGFNSDLVAAIDQAVADGVDVINYSISGTQSNFLDPAQIAFLFAADAGVFVSTSAGNSGPASGTVAHPSPWTTTVAAGTHNRNGEGSVTLGNGATYSGASVANAVGPAPLVNASAAGLPGADATEVALCYSAADNEGKPVLDPAKVAGKIVVCDRGVTARIAKSAAVREAGGIGMILVNTSPSSINADFHFVPTVHLADTARAAVQAYAASAGATARINQATIVYNVPAPFTASFSSRGPSPAAGGDLLKPDVIAPGQDILAAVAPPGNGGRNFDIYSGTSMSAPHVAGLAALLKGQHPDWSPMMIKSALMTTASDILDGPNTHPLVIFRQGAGHVVPNRAGDPGLVFDAGINDWLALLCGATTAVNPAACSQLEGLGYSFDASDVNVASIAIADLAGSQTVKRTVTNVGAATATYTSSVIGLAGVTATVEPASFQLAPGQSRSFTVTFRQNTAALNAYTAGYLTLSSDDAHTVRVPMIVRPVALAAPAEVSGTGGPISYNVTFGYSGAFSPSARGLIPATLFPGTVADDPADSFSPTGAGVTSFEVVIPAGTTLARFSTFDANVSPASDLDLYVYRGTTLVAISGGGTSEEQAQLLNPPAGTYTVYVHGFGVPGTANFTLFSWVLGGASAGNMNVSAPAAAVSGGTGTVSLSFTGLAPATKYLGTVAYGAPASSTMPTVVRVDTP